MEKGKIVCLLLAAMTLCAFSGQSASGQEACPVPEGTKVILLESSWSFDPPSGLLKGSATVLNASGSDAVAPGVVIGLYNMEGKQFDNVSIRGKKARVAPGERTEVTFEIQLQEIPLSVLIGPIEGMAFT